MALAVLDLICSVVVVLLLVFMSAAIAIYNLNDEQRRSGK